LRQLGLDPVQLESSQGPTPAYHDLVIAPLTRQCDNPQLREWLTRRKAGYFETVGKTGDCRLLTYAAARDFAFSARSGHPQRVRVAQQINQFEPRSRITIRSTSTSRTTRATNKSEHCQRIIYCRFFIFIA